MSTDTLIRVAYVYSGICAVCDFALGLLPIDLVRQLQTTLKTKIALGATLSLGCVYVNPPMLLVQQLTCGVSRASTAVILRIPCLHFYKDIDFLCKCHAS